MIKLFGRLFWYVTVGWIPGPKDADRPVLIVVEDYDGKAN